MPDDRILVTGFEEVKRIFESWKGEKLLRSLRRAQRAALRPVNRDAKRLQPVGETGNLRRSYKVRAAKRKRGRVVHRVTSSSRDVQNSQGVYYGGFQHWGWIVPSTGEKIEGNDVLTRAAEQNRNNIEPIMVRVMREELENV